MAVLVAMIMATASAGDRPDAPAGTQPAASAPLPIEGFMLVSGTLRVEADGRVSSHAINQAERLPGEVRALLDRRIPQWRFAIDRVVSVPPLTLRFSLPVRATPVGGQSYRLWLDQPAIDWRDLPGEGVAVTRRPRPEYPRDLARMGATGVAYVVMRVGLDGAVEDVFVEQVDLTTVPSDLEQAKQIQLGFIGSAAAAARRWRFAMPARGPLSGKQVPVRVAFDFGSEAPAYGEWRYLVRGLRREAPWLPGVAGGASIEAIARSGSGIDDGGIRLLPDVFDDGT